MNKTLLLPVEIWVDIPDYEGLYQASNLGRIRSLDRMVNARNGGKRFEKGIILKPRINEKGYQRVSLWKNRKMNSFRVHRLVYAAFCGEIPEGYDVNHINEDKTDNRLENLNLLTHQENMSWGTINERISKAMLNHPKLSKPVIGYNSEGNVVVTFPSAKEAGRNGYDHSAISKCCKGTLIHYKGLYWKYKDGDC